MDVYSELERLAKDSLKLLILKAVEEGKAQAQEVIEYLREGGLEVAQSTVYTALKELEKEGLLRAEGTRNKRYELTEEGRRTIAENSAVISKFKEFSKRAKIMKVLGIKSLLEAIADLVKVVDELSPEERAEVAVSVGALTAVLRKAVAKRVSL